MVLQSYTPQDTPNPYAMKNTLTIVSSDDGLVNLQPMVDFMLDYLEHHSMKEMEIEIMEMITVLNDLDECHYLANQREHKIQLCRSIIAMLKACRNA